MFFIIKHSNNWVYNQNLYNLLFICDSHMFIHLNLLLSVVGFASLNHTTCLKQSRKKMQSLLVQWESTQMNTSKAPLLTLNTKNVKNKNVFWLVRSERKNAKSRKRNERRSKSAEKRYIVKKRNGGAKSNCAVNESDKKCDLVEVNKIVRKALDVKTARRAQVMNVLETARKVPVMNAVKIVCMAMNVNGSGVDLVRLLKIVDGIVMTDPTPHIVIFLRHAARMNVNKEIAEIPLGTILMNARDIQEDVLVAAAVN